MPRWESRPGKNAVRRGGGQRRARSRNARTSGSRLSLRPRARGERSIEEAIERQPWGQLATLLDAGGADPEGVIARLKLYAREVIQWNRHVSNIMSRNEEERFVERHLVESLAALEMARATGAGRWVDLGSGAGLPAVPLALAGVGDEWKLVESRRMKSLFLQRFVSSQGLGSIEVVCARLEHLATRPEWQGSCDGMTSRATLKIVPTLALAESVVRHGGHLLLWKGSSWEQEWLAAGARCEAWQIEHAQGLKSNAGVILHLRRC